MASRMRVTSLMDEARSYHALPITAKTIGHRTRNEPWTAGTRFLLHRTTKDVVKIAMGLVTTMTALALGPLVARRKARVSQSAGGGLVWFRRTLLLEFYPTAGLILSGNLMYGTTEQRGATKSQIGALSMPDPWRGRSSPVAAT